MKNKQTVDDRAYANADRQYKQGVIRDNPLMCCAEVTLDSRKG